MPTDRPRRRLLPIALGVAAYALVLLFGVLVARTAAWSGAEMDLVIAVNGTHTPFLDAIAYTINVVLGPVGAVVVSLALIATLWTLSRNTELATRMVLLIAASWAVAELTKSVVDRPRPDPSLLPCPSSVEPHSYSYPSGHTAFAVAITLSLVLVLAPGISRRIAVGVAVVVVTLTAWSRVYLGVHYPSDVLASMIAVPATMLVLLAILPPARSFARIPLGRASS